MRCGDAEEAGGGVEFDAGAGEVEGEIAGVGELSVGACPYP